MMMTESIIFSNMLYDWRPGHSRFAGTVIQPFDTKTRTVTGERKQFYYGTSLGVCEGPQILKKRWVLLPALCSRGLPVTDTLLRWPGQKCLEGPWQESPYFPLLTSCDDGKKHLAKKRTCVFCTYRDEWYITHICARPLTKRGRCTLGRETALQKITWVDGWPRLESGTHFPQIAVAAPQGKQLDPAKNRPQRKRYLLTV